jgi:prepilin-type N-terminal cleavage/methylation domain-containing protein
MLTSYVTRQTQKIAHKKSPGFTIVELLIVIVVIGILAAITIVAFNGVKDRAILSSMSGDLSNNSKQLGLFNAEFGRYPSAASDQAWMSANLVGGATGVASNDATYTYNPTAAMDGYTQTISKGSVLLVNSDTNTTPTNQNTKPVAPTVSLIATTSFKLSWAAISSATSYGTTCARNAALTTAPVTTGTTTIPEFNSTAMFGGTIYYCAYKPMFGTVAGTISTSSASITTTTPSVPSNLAASTITATSFKLNWSNVTGAYRYNLQCANSTDTAYASPVYSHTGTSLSSGTTGVTISSGLTASTSYICRVASKGYNNASTYSSDLSVTTPAA